MSVRNLLVSKLFNETEENETIYLLEKTKEIHAVYIWLVQNFSKKEVALFKIKFSKLAVFLSHLLGYIPYILT